MPLAFHQQGGQRFNRCRLDGTYHRSIEDGEDGDEVQSPQMNNIESEHMKQVVSEIIDIFSKVEGLVGSELHQLRFTGRYQRKFLPGLDGVCPVCFVLMSPKKMP